MKRSTLIAAIFFVILLASGLGIGLYFLLRSKESSPKGAVATSTEECTTAALDILRKGGSAVDAAISAALCQGVAVPQSSGLGGGFIATVYIKETGTIETINAREVAPLAAFKDMYAGGRSSREGGLAVAVPTELKGLFELHKKYGKLKWSEIVDPVAEIAQNGFKVAKYLAGIFEERGEKIKAVPNLKNYFTDPKTGNFYRLGDTLSNPKLANTLKIISKEGADAFYGKSGTFTQKIVDEIKSEGGIITIEDLTNYKPKWGKPVESKLFTGDTLYNFPLPATGHIITFILNILNGFKIQDQSIDYHNENKLYYHRLIESFKFAFAKRTKLGDETTEEVLSTLKDLESLEVAEMIRLKIDDDKTFDDFAHYGTNTSNVVDHGTGHVSILAPNGDAVALTSTINIVMGAYIMSESTGMIYNDEMNDFSIPREVSDGLLPAPANFIDPGKSPISSMAPMIILDENKDVSLVIGGTGGILIMTTIVQVLISYYYFNHSLEDAFENLRLHHQLNPMAIKYEEGYDDKILQFLENKGHKVEQYPSIITGFASVIAVANRKGKIEAAVDERRGGSFGFV